MEDTKTGHLTYFHHQNSSFLSNRTQNNSLSEQQLDTIVIGINNNTFLYKTHKGIFRQCNYLSLNVRERLKLSKCRLLKLGNNRYDDAIHGMNNPGRELIRRCFLLAIENPLEKRTRKGNKNKDF